MDFTLQEDCGVTKSCTSPEWGRVCCLSCFTMQTFLHSNPPQQLMLAAFQELPAISSSSPLSPLGLQTSGITWFWVDLEVNFAVLLHLHIARSSHFRSLKLGQKSKATCIHQQGKAEGAVDCKLVFQSFFTSAAATACAASAAAIATSFTSDGTLCCGASTSRPFPQDSSFLGSSAPTWCLCHTNTGNLFIPLTASFPSELWKNSKWKTNCYAYLRIQKIQKPQYNLLNSFSKTSFSFTMQTILHSNPPQQLMLAAFHKLPAISSSSTLSPLALQTSGITWFWVDVKVNFTVLLHLHSPEFTFQKHQIRSEIKGNMYSAASKSRGCWRLQVGCPKFLHLCSSNSLCCFCCSYCHTLYMGRNSLCWSFNTKALSTGVLISWVITKHRLSFYPINCQVSSELWKNSKWKTNCYAYLLMQKICKQQYNLVNSFSKTSMEYH